MSRCRRPFVALVRVCMLGFGSLLSSLVHGQSFDCVKAVTAIERAVCADKSLAALDVKLAADFHQLIAAQPARRTALLSDQRQWLDVREQHCGAESANEAMRECLTLVYSARITELAQIARDATGAHPSSCRKIAERYRPLANSHLGVDPLQVLAESPGSGFKLAEVSVAEPVKLSSADLPAWAAAQKPPFSLAPVLLDVLKAYQGGGGTGELIRAPGTDFYSFTRHDESETCEKGRSFIVQGGIAVPAATPWVSDNDDGTCGAAPSFGTLDRSPVVVVRHYDWNPGMNTGLDVWMWTEQGVWDECQVWFSYKPFFSKETTNSWDDMCEGADCDELLRISFKLAESAEADLDSLKSGSFESLTPKQRDQFDEMARLFDSHERDPASNDAVNIPFLDHDHLYLVSIGHHAIGWRDYPDYSVMFEELADGRLIPRGTFSVGTWKGELEDMSVGGD
jgi:uncharacterized protein